MSYRRDGKGIHADEARLERAGLKPAKPTSSCQHPDPATVPVLFCRTCGFFENGVRVADASNDQLRAMLKPGDEVRVLPAYENTHDGQTEPSLWPPLDDEGFPF